MAVLPEIGTDHIGIGPDLLRCPFGDLPTEVEHRDAVADAEDQRNVMLDQQNGGVAPLGDPPDDRPDLGALMGVQTGGRLVEEQHVRIGEQRPGHADEPRPAMRKLSGLAVQQIRQPELLDDLFHGDRRTLPPRTDHVGEVVPQCLGVRGGEQILPDAHVREQLDRLEGPGQPGPCPPYRRPSGDGLPVEQHLARRRLGEAGDDVQQGRLARAIGADQPQHLARLNAQVDVAERLHPTETDAEITHLKHRGLTATAGGRPVSGSAVGSVGSVGSAGRAGRGGTSGRRTVYSRRWRWC